MANLPFDREIINALERPLSSDINVAQSQLDYTIRWALYQMYAPKASISDPSPTWRDGFVGNGFRVVSSGGMNVQVLTGMGLFNAAGDVPTNIDSIAGLDDRCALKPLVLVAAQTLAVPAADPGAERYDIVEVKYERSTENPTARDILNPGTGTFVSNVVDKTLAFALDGKTSVNGAQSINYKTGVAGAGAPPAVTAGYTRIAVIYVPAAAVALTQSNIADWRWLLSPGGVHRVSLRAEFDFGAGSGSLLDCMCSPGVQVTATGLGDIIIVGGQAPTTYAECQVNWADPPPVAAGTIMGANMIVVPDVVTGGIQTAMAAATPSILCAVGQTIVRGKIYPYTQAANVTTIPATPAVSRWCASVSWRL